MKKLLICYAIAALLAFATVEILKPGEEITCRVTTLQQT